MGGGGVGRGFWGEGGGGGHGEGEGRVGCGGVLLMEGFWWWDGRLVVSAALDMLVSGCCGYQVVRRKRKLVVEEGESFEIDEWKMNVSTSSALKPFSPVAFPR